MKLAFEVLAATTKLEVAAAYPDATADKLRVTMLRVAADLSRAVEEFGPRWGELTAIIKQLEKTR